MSLTRSLLFALPLCACLASPVAADILIAINAPMTGSYAIFGDQLKRGGEYIIKQLNEKGGVLGQKLVLTIGDDACDPRQAVAVANKAATSGAKLVVGH